VLEQGQSLPSVFFAQGTPQVCSMTAHARLFVEYVDFILLRGSQGSRSLVMLADPVCYSYTI
jgi:hypothetical protein